jgi:putative spermidine/putrescine transport system ATP-binding protein
VRTRVSLLGHDDFVIKVPNSAGHQHLKTGESVKVGWQAEDCRALDYL